MQNTLVEQAIINIELEGKKLKRAYAGMILTFMPRNSAVKNDLDEIINLVDKAGLFASMHGIEDLCELLTLIKKTKDI